MTDNKMPEGFKLSDLKDNYDTCVRQYAKAFERAVMLDTVDRGYLWEAIGATVPSYQILGDSNHTSYVKNNLVASIYTVGKAAEVMPTSDADKQVVADVNNFLEFFWQTSDLGYLQMQAGERAALFNLGITQVGWDTSLTGGNGSTYYKGAPTYKNVNPLKFMRDPFAVDLESSGYCMVWDNYHKSVLLRNPMYKDTFTEYLSKHKEGNSGGSYPPAQVTDKVVTNTSSDKNYFRLVIHWVRDEDAIHEIHTIDNQEILLVKKNIKPSEFPFAMCYCNLPNEDLLGTSEPAKILANSIAYNVLISTIITAEFKNQRPPRFINGQSGLNVSAFTRYGNDADKAFVVSGDASKAVHYQQYPTVSNQAFGVLGSLSGDITQVTGIDAHYTGKNTGSITTTGGIENMLAQATLIDAPKIVNYEAYAKKLTRLTLGNLIHFGGKRTYIKQDKTTKKYITKEVNFKDISNDAVYNYEINISTQLPKNKQRIAEFATELLEKQAQYAQQGQQVDWIQPEEWLYFQDNPIRELMTERMGLQRNQNLVEDAAETIMGFAGLTKQGVDPNEAILAMAQNLQNKRMPQQAATSPIMDMSALEGQLAPPGGGMPMPGV